MHICLPHDTQHCRDKYKYTYKYNCKQINAYKPSTQYTPLSRQIQMHKYKHTYKYYCKTNKQIYLNAFHTIHTSAETNAKAHIQLHIQIQKQILMPSKIYTTQYITYDHIRIKKCHHFMTYLLQMCFGKYDPFFPMSS